MQWDDIRYFLALKRAGNLSAAARELRIRHTTVSRRVEALEQALGVKLFDRLPRGWVATEEGEALWPQAVELERQALEFSRSALGQSGEAGCVRLAAPPVLLSHFLVSRLGSEGWHEAGLRVHLIAGTSATNLIQGEADLALRVGLPVQQSELVQRSLGQIGYGLYGTHEQLARAPAERRYLGFDQAMTGSSQARWLQEVAGERPRSLLSNDLEVLYQAARAGWGVAVLPHFLGRKAPELSCANLGQRWQRPLSLLTHPSVRRAPRVARVMRQLVELVLSAASELDPA
jgi:DNA-binding transcriptional LysR family regulator